MINVLDDVKNLYKSDSVIKKYFVIFRDYGQLKDNSQMTSESLQITESICSAGNFKVGLCESGNCKVSVVIDDNVKGDEITVFQVLGNFEPEITNPPIARDTAGNLVLSTDTEGVQLSGEGLEKLTTTFTSTNIISGLDTENFFKDENYLILAKFKYVGRPIYLYVKNTADTERMVYYLKPGLFNFSNLQEWDTETAQEDGYKNGAVVLHNDFVWQSRTTANSIEPGTLINGELSNAWTNITRYVQVAIPIIGNEFYEYQMGIYAKSYEPYGTLVGTASIYKLDYPIMPLGLYTVKSCKKKDDNNIRNIEAYDRMLDVGLDIDVYFDGTNPSDPSELKTIQMGQVLDQAAENTQIVIGSNLSKMPVNTIQLDNETLPFPDFPQDDETTPSTDEGIIYQTTKTETQTVDGDKYDATSVTGKYNVMLYATMRGTVIDADNNSWTTYSNNGQLRIMSKKRRQSKEFTDSRTEQRQSLGTYYYCHFEEYIIYSYDEITGEPVGEWVEGEGEFKNVPSGSNYRNVWVESSYTKYGSWYSTDGYDYYIGFKKYESGKEYTCYGIGSEYLKSSSNTSRTYNRVCTFYYYTQYGYYYPEIDKTDTRKWEVGQRWSVVTSEYFPSDIDIPYASNYYDEDGNQIKQYAYIDCSYQYYYNYDVDTDFINQLLAERWVFHHETGFNKYEWKTLAEREGKKYSSENINRIYSASEVWNSIKKYYQREVVYKWYENAELKMTPYIIPQGTYDSTLAYTVYITYPTDMAAYLEENQAYELAMEQVEEFTNDDGSYHSIGVLNINKQDEVRQAILDNSSKNCFVEQGSYTIDNITYIGGRFYIYWVQELSYNCYVSYNGGTFTLDGDKSRTVRSANPFIKCVSHSQAEKFNYLNIDFSTETVHGNRRSIVAGFMELHGMFINFDRWGVSTTRNVRASTLYPAENLYPHDSTIPGNEAYGDIYPSTGSMEVTDISICKSIYIDDYLNDEFDGVVITKSQVTALEASLFPFYYNRMTKRYGIVPDQMPEVSTTPWEGNNYYHIDNNFFIDNFVFGQTTAEIRDNLIEICQTILDNIGDLQYFNLTAELRCLPYMEVGDNINIMTPKNGYETAILRRVMKGNVAQMDSIETDFYD